MANQGVQGRVVDNANPPVGIQNLIIEVYDHDVLTADDFLGTATTDANELSSQSPRGTARFEFVRTSARSGEQQQREEEQPIPSCERDAESE
jgi:hypothetical protein